MTLRVLTVLMTGLLTTQFLAAQVGWYDAGWSYRAPVTVTNSTGSPLTDYQVQVSLGISFSWGSVKTDGSDIRFTASDGTTLIPYWIESWTHGTSAVIWIKVPTLPTGTSTVYIYYGNPAPTVPPPVQVETPPSGPFTKNSTKIIPIGIPGGRTSLVCENIVKDDATGGHYWLVFTDQTTATPQVCLAYSDDPTNPNAWYWSGVVINNAIAPHLMKYNGTWYIFYGDRSVGPPYPISVATAASPGGPYTYQTTSSAGRCSQVRGRIYRVDEPCVFQRSSDDKWIMIYMGNSGRTVEQIGYATADDILGTL